MGYTVKIVGDENDWTRNDGDDDRRYAYQVQPSGALRLLIEEDGAWRIHMELSPAGWIHVSGRRYVDATDRLHGDEENAKRPRSAPKAAIY